MRLRLRSQYGVDPNTPVLIGGSVHRGEDKALAWAYKRLIDTGRKLCLVLAPRYPAEVPFVLGELDNLGLEGVRKTELTNGKQVFDDPLRVLILDTMGELRSFYAMSDIAYVGGSLHYRASNTRSSL